MVEAEMEVASVPKLGKGGKDWLKRGHARMKQCALHHAEGAGHLD
jgi:hypothetical protein